MRSQREAGQILLIVILAVIVASTVGLSLASRSITSLRSSTEEAESQKALSAAEAGIERALQSNVFIGNTTLNNNSKYTTEESEELDGREFLINGGNIIPQTEGADIWLVPHDDDGTPNYSPPTWSGDLTIYWGDSTGACNNSALEIIIVSGSKDSPNVKKYAYDPCSDRRDGEKGNNLAPPLGGGSVDGTDFQHSAIIKDISSGLIARVIPLYGNTVGGVVGSIDLPSQGTVDTATGVSGSATRKIVAFKGHGQTYLPYLSYGLFVAD